MRFLLCLQHFQFWVYLQKKDRLCSGEGGNCIRWSHSTMRLCFKEVDQEPAYWCCSNDDFLIYTEVVWCTRKYQVKIPIYWLSYTLEPPAANLDCLCRRVWQRAVGTHSHKYWKPITSAWSDVGGLRAMYRDCGQGLAGLRQCCSVTVVMCTTIAVNCKIWTFLSNTSKEVHLVSPSNCSTLLKHTRLVSSPLIMGSWLLLWSVVALSSCV